MGFSIRPGDFSDPRVIALLRHHYEQNRAVTPEGSAHVLDLGAMQVPEIAFFTLWDGEALLGIGALRDFGDGSGEIKSMRTADHALRRGVAAAMLAHLIAHARTIGLARLYLETGSFAYFEPARKLYARFGFTECPPFQGYTLDPNSIYMVRELEA
jgi:putative acetyltransferase